MVINESVTKTVEDFQVRRIEWVIAELDKQGEDIMEWKVLRLAALRKSCSDKIRQIITQDYK